MTATRNFRGCRTAAILAAAFALGLAAQQQAAAQAQVSNKWLTVVLPAEPNGIESCNSNRVYEGRVVKFNVTESLVQKNAQDGSLRPRLATSWQQVDPSTWRFKLREGVT